MTAQEVLQRKKTASNRAKVAVIRRMLLTLDRVESGINNGRAEDDSQHTDKPR